MQIMKPIRMVVKLQNNLLKERREALGLSAPELAERAGISYQRYIALEGIRVKPTSKQHKSGWCLAARVLADFYSVLPEDLFPGVVLAVDKSIAERTFDAEEIRALLPESLRQDALGPDVVFERKQLEAIMNKTLETLTAIERKVIEGRFGFNGESEKTLREIGDSIGISVERTRQLEVIALQKLRHPQRHKRFIAFASQATQEYPWGRIP